MPSAVHPSINGNGGKAGIIKFTNCRLLKGRKLVQEDLWISSSTGKILDGQVVFFEEHAAPDEVIDLKGKILSPGFIDVQFNGAFGFDFSLVPEDITTYAKGLVQLNKSLVRTGVTSYLPTIVSQKSNVYHKALPLLAPSSLRSTEPKGAESLGAHCEGPFLNPLKSGIHEPSVLRAPQNGIPDLEAWYGVSNLSNAQENPIKLVTIAPEQPGALSAIRDLTSRQIAVAIGHSEASYEDAQAALDAGATMITHLFNAMLPLHHRNPGIFGVLGSPNPETDLQTSPKTVRKPYFGLIADGIHLHPTTLSIASASHPEGVILVTDSMSLAGLPDGVHEWTNGTSIRKRGILLTLEHDDDKIAGCAISLMECVNNYINWTGRSVAEALGTVTETPAKMLHLDNAKGLLVPGADADLVVLEEDMDDKGWKELKVEQVWKFGECVFGQD